MKRTLLLSTILAVIVGSTPVLAAESVQVPAMAVQVWPEGEPGQMLVVVSAEIPPGAELPAAVDLPLIEGAELLWSGEVLGGDPNADIEREGTLVEATGGQALRIGLESGRVAQYEAVTGRLAVDGDEVSGTVRWLQSVRTPVTRFSVRLPSGAREISVRPAAVLDPRRNRAGELLYTLPDREIEPGDEVSVDVSYRRAAAVLPASGSGQGGGAGGGSTVLIVVLGAVAAAAGALALMVHRRSTAEQAQP
ncbi:MAG: hypothetical protein IBX62_01780 [Coriobacteriia bacterium]|nr:hypothetical protein [Coriobacteriia bacterium]